MSNRFLSRLPLPDPVDEIYFKDADWIETMIIRADRSFVKWPYTITDCYVTRWVRISLLRYKPIRVLDPVLLEAKRREMFGYAYEELVRELPKPKEVNHEERGDARGGKHAED